MARAAALALCMGFALCQSALGIADFAHRDPYEIEVQWVLQGREFQFTGFFIEFLGISSALHRKLPQMRLTQSSFSYHYNESALHDQKFFDKLFEKESRNLQILYGKRYNGTAQLQAPVSEIGEFQISASCLAAAEGVLDPDTTAMTDMWRPEVEASSVAACCQACSSTPLCIGWSMTSFSDLDRLHCLLKGSLLKQASDHDLAAMRESPRTDHASGSNMLSARNSKGNSQKPRVKIFHGTTCFYNNFTILKPSIYEIRIGRYMVEREYFGGGMTLDELAVLKCAVKMDEIWVPTIWNKQIFDSYLRSVGFTEDIVHVIPEAVDVELFDRKSAKLVKPPWSGNAMCGEEVTVIDKEQDGASSRPVFEFLSVFKWERRKGWDVLLDAYWQEFSPDDEVLLRLHSYVPSWVRGETNITRILEEYAYKKYGKSLDEVAAVVWDTEGNDSSGLSRADVRDLYASADAFVLPTRGEGWGLPIAEAMAMELPVIVSNFSGPAAFANDTNAYMIPMTGNFDELGFALPSKDALRYIMRQVIRDSCPISGGGLTVAARRAHLGRASIAWWSPDRVVEAMSVRLKVLAQQRGYYA